MRRSMGEGDLRKHEHRYIALTSGVSRVGAESRSVYVFDISILVETLPDVKCAPRGCRRN